MHTVPLVCGVLGFFCTHYKATLWIRKAKQCWEGRKRSYMIDCRKRVGLELVRQSKERLKKEAGFVMVAAAVVI